MCAASLFLQLPAAAAGTATPSPSSAAAITASTPSLSSAITSSINRFPMLPFSFSSTANSIPSNSVNIPRSGDPDPSFVLKPPSDTPHTLQGHSGLVANGQLENANNVGVLMPSPLSSIPPTPDSANNPSLPLAVTTMATSAPILYESHISKSASPSEAFPFPATADQTFPCDATSPSLPLPSTDVSWLSSQAPLPLSDIHTLDHAARQNATALYPSPVSHQASEVHLDPLPQQQAVDLAFTSRLFPDSVLTQTNPQQSQLPESYANGSLGKHHGIGRTANFPTANTSTSTTPTTTTPTYLSGLPAPLSVNSNLPFTTMAIPPADSLSTASLQPPFTPANSNPTVAVPTTGAEIANASSDTTATGSDTNINGSDTIVVGNDLVAVPSTNPSSHSEEVVPESPTFAQPFDGPLPVKHRRRTTKGQLRLLESTFEKTPKPSSAVRKQLGVQLGMPPRVVQIWFQNRRAKVKTLARKEAAARETTQYNSNELQAPDVHTSKSFEATNTGERNNGDSHMATKFRSDDADPASILHLPYFMPTASPTSLPISVDGSGTENISVGSFSAENQDQQAGTVWDRRCASLPSHTSSPFILETRPKTAHKSFVENSISKDTSQAFEHDFATCISAATSKAATTTADVTSSTPLPAIDAPRRHRTESSIPQLVSIQQPMLYELDPSSNTPMEQPQQQAFSRPLRHDFSVAHYANLSTMLSGALPASDLSTACTNGFSEFSQPFEGGEQRPHTANSSNSSGSSGFFCDINSTTCTSVCSPPSTSSSYRPF